MSAFHDQLKLRALSHQECEAIDGIQRYELLSDFRYTSDLLKADITVPVGFVTDFGSIPRPCWWYMDPEDPAIVFGSVVHDVLYKYSGRLPNFPDRVFTRLEADSLLREAMKLCGARFDQYNIVFAAVRTGGWIGASHWVDGLQPQTMLEQVHYECLRLELLKTNGVPRSPHWRAVRASHLKNEGWCRACGGTDFLEVHHIKPFHLHPDLELVDSNLITLCENSPTDCHLVLGHLGNWKDFNPNVRAQCNALPNK